MVNDDTKVTEIPADFDKEINSSFLLWHPGLDEDDTKKKKELMYGDNGRNDSNHQLAVNLKN